MEIECLQLLMGASPWMFVILRLETVWVCVCEKEVGMICDEAFLSLDLRHISWMAMAY